MGFDDLTFSDLIDPPLTTLEYPVTSMAQAVVDCILAKIDGRSISDSSLVFDPILKVKGSTSRLD